MKIKVCNYKGLPISNAKINFIAGSDPHHVLHHEEKLITDTRGIVSLESRHQFEVVAPLMMHGVPFYYWEWCVEKDGYAPRAQKVFSTDHIKDLYEIQLEEESTTKMTCVQRNGFLSIEKFSHNQADAPDQKPVR